MSTYYYFDASGTKCTVDSSSVHQGSDGNYYDSDGHLCHTDSQLDGYVDGTSGNDVIDTNYTGDPQGDMIDHGDAVLPGAGANDDYVRAGDGNDSVYANQGNDIVYGGSGDDHLYGGVGSDSLYGDAGSDHLYGGSGNDLESGGTGNDVLYAGSGDDTLYGGAGNDVLVGGGPDACDPNADDMMVGGSGNDTFIGGSGNDSMFGGTGSDHFSHVHAGDFVDGGEPGCEGTDNGPQDHDTLDLTGAGPFHIVYDPNNPENGTVNFLDPNGNITGSMGFKNIECIIPCFTPGMRIATPKGERLVEELKAGDKVITRDNGIQEIRWIGHKQLDGKTLAGNPHLKPILIQKGALGGGLPEEDMLVSPNHRVLVANDRTALYFDEHEVLVAAKHLVNHQGIHEVSRIGITYTHFMFDHHEVVLSNGAWTESFQPGDYTLKGIGNAQRNELFELFPELKTLEGVEAYAAARKTLKKHEAMLLIK
jgi:hypothetical protein